MQLVAWFMRVYVLPKTCFLKWPFLCVNIYLQNDDFGVVVMFGTIGMKLCPM